MDFKQFHYFVTTAEELHITRAAARLGIAQPVLSQQIKALEDRLGLRLFERKQRGIELTAAGAAFLVEARGALEQARKAEWVAKRIALGNVGVLEIGHVGSASFDPHLFSALTVYRQSHPGVKLRLHGMEPQKQLDAMREGWLDLAIVRGPLGVLPDEFESVVFSSQMLVIALSSTHRQVRNKSIPMDVLAGDTFISTHDPAGVGLGGALHAYCQASGFTPDIALHASDITARACLVAAGQGISLEPDSIAVLKMPNICSMPIRGIDTRSDLLLVHRKYERSTALLALLATLKTVRQN